MTDEAHPDCRGSYHRLTQTGVGLAEVQDPPSRLVPTRACCVMQTAFTLRVCTARVRKSGRTAADRSGFSIQSGTAVCRTCTPSAICTSPRHRICRADVVAIAATEHGPTWRHILAPIGLLSFDVSWNGRDLFPYSRIMGMPHARVRTCANPHLEELSPNCKCYSSFQIE